MEMEILMFVKTSIFTHGKKKLQCTTMHFYTTVGGVNTDFGFDIELILLLMMLSMLILIIYPDW